MERDRLTADVRRYLLLLRDDAKMTDRAWARAAEVRQQDLSRFVTGSMLYPSLGFMDALARVFDLDIAHVLDLVMHNKAPTRMAIRLSDEELDTVRKLRTMTPRFKKIYVDLLDVAPTRTPTRKRTA